MVRPGSSHDDGREAQDYAQRGANQRPQLSLRHDLELEQALLHGGVHRSVDLAPGDSSCAGVLASGVDDGFVCRLAARRPRLIIIQATSRVQGTVRAPTGCGPTRQSTSPPSSTDPAQLRLVRRRNDAEPDDARWDARRGSQLWEHRVSVCTP